MKKLFLSVLTLAFVLGLISPLTTYAQDKCAGLDWWAPSGECFAQKVDSAPPTEIFGERYTQAQVFWIFYSLQKVLFTDKCAGQSDGSPEEFQKCVELDPNASLNSPILQLAMLSDGMMATRPVSGVAYIAQKIDNFQVIPTAYAQVQGAGYRALEPVQKIWLASRNAAYLLMAFVVIIFGFMIMFRTKISPQTVVTVQSALPRIAIALLLIAFSYAIAGLLIDLAYVAQGLIATIAKGAGIIRPDGGVYPSLSIIEIFNKMNNPTMGLFAYAYFLIIQVLVIGLGPGIAVAVGSAGVAVPLVLAVSGVLVVVILIVFAVALLRIFWLMLQTYAKVVLMVAFLPFTIIGGVFTGGSVGPWLRQLAAQMSVFVSVSTIIFVAHAIAWLSVGADVTQDLMAGVATWDSVNPYRITTGVIGAGSVQMPAFSGFPISIISFFLSFGIILSIPKLASSIRDHIATGRGSYGFDSSGVILGAGIPIVGGLVGGQMKRAQTATSNVVGTMAGTRLARTNVGQRVKTSLGQLQKQEASEPAATGQINTPSENAADRLG